MSSAQEIIEAKLSQAFGCEAKFQRLQVFPLKRSLVAEGLRVGGPSDQPIFTAARITAQIAVTKILLGEISITEMVIESPELFLAFKPRGRASSGKSGGKFEAKSIRVRNGKVSWQKNSQLISASQITAEVKQQSGSIELTATVGEVTRMGRVEITGSIASGDFAELLDAHAAADLRFASGLHIAIESPGLQMLLRG
jgi:uncharacterized protein involved in outer membrane biogenesis